MPLYYLLLIDRCVMAEKHSGAQSQVQRVHERVYMVTAHMSALQVIGTRQEVTTEAIAGDYGY